METTILRWKGNWADEMDVYGLVFVEPDKADEIVSTLPKYTNSIEVQVGTNEEVEYRNGEQLARAITRVDLTEDEAATVKKALGIIGSWYGHFPDVIFDIVEELKENE